MAAKRKRKRAAKRVQLADMMTVDERIRWLVLDVMRLQNQYAELLRSIGALQLRVDLAEHKPKRSRHG